MGYSTGNPLGSADPRDLYDNAENLDQAMNKTGSNWTDRLGRARKTFQAAENAADAAEQAADNAADAAEQAADNAVNTLIPAEVDRAANYVETILEPDSADELDESVAKSALRAEAARDAAFVNADVYDDVAAGLAAVADGEQFQVIDGDEIVRYRRDSSSSQTEVARYPSASAVSGLDSLRVNQGKAYPFADTVREGVYNPAHSFMLDGILDIQVVGAEQGKLYKLDTIINGSTIISGANPTGWHIYEHDAAAFSDTDDTAQVVVSRNDAGPEIDRTRISTIVLESKNRPGLKFYITIDGTKLPDVGTVVNMATAGFPGYNWYIDPAIYRYENFVKTLGSVDSLSINSGKIFPFNAGLPRSGETSANYQRLMDLILGVDVIGAEEGKYYRIAYLSNSGEENASLGWILEEFDAATYETDAVSSRIHSYTSAGGTVRRDGSIQTVVVPCADRPGVTFRITMDTAHLLPAGSPLMAVNPGFSGYSWIVDPSRYFYRAESEPVPAGGLTGNGVYYEFDATTQIVSYAYKSGEQLYKVTFGVNGYNDLPNIIGIYKAPLADSIAEAEWTKLSTVSTDYLPPMIIQALNDGDGGTQIYTGGNHGADGGDGGGQTARNTVFSIFADGQLLTTSAAGFASVVQAHVVNELNAYNTISAGRYVLRQAFRVDMTASGMEVTAEVTALEPIKISTDNGPQAYFGGFTASQLMLGGQTTERIPLDTSLSSGPKSDYPDAWCLLMKSSHGTMACWVDRSYEAGDGRYVADVSPFIRGPGEERAKFYHAICASTGPTLGAGEGYKWRGGYHFFADTGNDRFDTVASLRVGDSARMVAGYHDASFLLV